MYILSITHGTQFFFKHKRFLRNWLPPNKHLGYVTYTALAIENGYHYFQTRYVLPIVRKREDQIISLRGNQ